MTRVSLPHDALKGSLDDNSLVQSWTKAATKAVAASLVAASLWTSPFMPNQFVDYVGGQLSTTSTIASAKEMASGSGSRVNKDPESLLRYGLPINNKEVCSYLVGDG